MIRRLKLKIYGKVQGVFFRLNIKRQADKIGLKGFVRNEQDGTVSAEAEGEEKILVKFIEFCKEGPSAARVEKIDENWTNELVNYKEFLIKK